MGSHRIQTVFAMGLHHVQNHRRNAHELSGGIFELAMGSHRIQTVFAMGWHQIQNHRRDDMNAAAAL